MVDERSQGSSLWKVDFHAFESYRNLAHAQFEVSRLKHVKATMGWL